MSTFAVARNDTVQHPSDRTIHRFHDVKIVDFGIAKMLPKPDSSTRMDTTTGAIFGTPMYMSPEQCEDTKLVDYRSDVYSLGCVMYEALTGKNPFAGANAVETLSRQLHTTPATLQDLGLDWEEDRVLVMSVNEVVMKMITKDPSKRYQSMEEARAAIGEIPEMAAKRIAVLSEVKNQYQKRSQIIDSKLGNSKKIVLTMGLVTTIIVCSAVYFWTNYVMTPDPKGEARAISFRTSLSDSARSQAVFEQEELALKTKLDKLKPLFNEEPIQKIEAVRRMADFYRNSEKYDAALFQYKLAHQLAKQNGLGTPISFSFSDNLDVNTRNAISASIKLSPNLSAQQLARIYIGMADCLLRQNHPKEASNACDYGIRILNKAESFYSPEAINVRHLLARAYDDLGAGQAAELQYRWCLANYGYDVDNPEKFTGSASLQNASRTDEFAFCLSDFAESALRRGEVSLAERVFSRVDALWESLGTAGGYNLAVTENELGIIAAKAQQPPEAEKHFSTAMQGFRKLGGPDDLSGAKAQFNLADAQWAAHDFVKSLNNKLNAKMIWKSKG